MASAPELDGTRSVTDAESARAVRYPVLASPDVPGWHRVERQLWTYSLEQLKAGPKSISWVIDTFQPDDPSRVDPLAGLQFSQAPLPEDPMTRLLPTETLANGLTVYLSPPPDGVAKGGGVSWFTADARYTLSSTVLTLGELKAVVSVANLEPLQSATA
jgi:hypothetical protein